MRMRKKTGYLLLTLLLLLVPVSAWADGTAVDDQAGLFSQEEEQELTDRIEELTADWNMDFVVVTTEDAEGKTSEEYADDYYDYNGYADDGALYMIDLDNGSVWISTAGKMIRYLTDARIDAEIDAGYDNLKAKNYAGGILEMLNETESYLEDGIPSDQYNYDTETGKISRYRSITVYEAIGAAVIALLCGVVAWGLIMMPANLIITPIFTGMPVEAIRGILLPIILPFNLIKAGINAVVTFLVYKSVSPLLHR